uniref:Uncharacterized protein n=1 Tax=Heterorhabditis bacteriophora TaxID=37862 RepID=A0A1I7WHG0_HETBA
MLNIKGFRNIMLNFKYRLSLSALRIHPYIYIINAIKANEM